MIHFAEYNNSKTLEKVLTKFPVQYVQNNPTSVKKIKGLAIKQSGILDFTNITPKTNEKVSVRSVIPIEGKRGIYPKGLNSEVPAPFVFEKLAKTKINGENIFLYKLFEGAGYVRIDVAGNKRIPEYDLNTRSTSGLVSSKMTSNKANPTGLIQTPNTKKNALDAFQVKSESIEVVLKGLKDYDFTGKQTYFSTLAEQLAGVINLETEITSNMTGYGNDNGVYNPSTNTIHIDLQNGGGNNDIARVLLHEMTHATMDQAISEYYKADGSLLNGVTADDVPAPIRTLRGLYEQAKTEIEKMPENSNIDPKLKAELNNAASSFKEFVAEMYSKP